MNKIMSVAMMTLAVASPAIASAATVTNLDDVTHTLVVTEGGQQIEITIAAGETLELCPQGCFIVMPNGDREVLTGPETLQIEASRGKIF